MTTRREILQWAAALSSLPALSRVAAARPGPAREPLELLFLGGTGFLGPHQIEHALARGHRVTIFNRGKTAPELYGERVEILIGDRDSKVGDGLKALEGTRRWDAVIDNSGYVPRHVRDSVELLADRCDRYLYVSTVAAYDMEAGGSFDESSRLADAPPPEVERVDGATYGPLKAECDRIARAALGERCTVVRPTYIVGPGDVTDRFTYWIVRMAQGGELLGPPEPDSELQWVDARDLCPWIVELVERDVPGVFNTAGPAEAVTWRQILEALAKDAPEPARIRWSTYEALDQAGVRLPLVRKGAPAHFDSSAAQAAGLSFRPLADTAAATRTWWAEQPEEERANPRGWPTPEQERAALALLAGG